jgi:hypothetical protein
MAAVDLANPTSWNLYAYVNDDPVNFNDPHGLFLPADNPDGQGLDDPFLGEDSFCDLYPTYPPCNQWGNWQGNPIRTFAGPGKVVVTGYSRTGPKETTIANDLDKILNQVLTGGCATWLTGPQYSASDFISAIMGSGPGDYTFGYGSLNNNATAAFVGNNNLDGTPIAGLPANATITVNANGAFFNSAYTVGSGFVQYTGGSLQAQIFILVHELAHEVGAAGFMPDAGNQSATNSNNALVQKNCGSQIAGVH